MKRWLVPALALMLFASLATTADATQRVVFFQDFTNVGCPPCEQVKDSMDQLITVEYVNTVVTIKTHVWWPSTDPFYDFNTAMSIDQVNKYGVGGVPDFYCDGKSIPNNEVFDSPAYWLRWRTVFDSLLTIPSKLDIQINEHYRTANSVYIDFDVVVTDTFVNQSALVYLAVTENFRRNIGQKYYYIQRQLYPDFNGWAVTLNTGQSYNYTYTYPMDPEYFPARIRSNIIVEKPATQKVLQSWRDYPENFVDVGPGAPPVRLVLEQNQPNPFNPRTRIPYQISESGNVVLNVFEPSGRHVTELFSGFRAAGTYDAVWTGLDNDGRDVGSGVYYYRIDTGNASETKKMILLR